MPFWAAVAAFAKFVFTSNALLAQGIRFVAGTILSQLLSGQQKVEGPRLSDLKTQTSNYGSMIPRLYGEAVRIAGNVIDKSDLIETKHVMKKKMLGITMAKQTTYTYKVHLGILLCEGELPANGIRRIFANGKVVFVNRTAGESIGGGTRWTRRHNTHGVMESVHFYPGSATQSPNSILSGLHPGQPNPAYRHRAYIVLGGLELEDYGNQVPNIEVELETNFRTVEHTLIDLCSHADVEMHPLPVASALKGYIIANGDSVWSAIEPLAATFSFDCVSEGGSYRARPRGRAMRTVLREEDFAARPSNDSPAEPAEHEREDANSYPDSVSVSYMDIARDYQPSTQTAARNAGYATNKVEIEVPIVLDHDEARQLAGRALAEALAGTSQVKIYVSRRLRWLRAADIVGVPVGGEIHSFRLNKVTQSPNGVVELTGVFDDLLAYSGTIPGAEGTFPANELELPGDTIMQPMDAPVLSNESDAGFYFAVAGTGLGWRGAEIFRADGVGSPLTYETIIQPLIPSIIGNCVSTLADGPTDVVDYANTLLVEVVANQSLTPSTFEGVMDRGDNLAWVGGADGQNGEYLHFIDATETGSPNVWTLSGLVRGRYGTEHATADHILSERFVLIDETLGRLDFGPQEWNVPKTWKPVSIYQDPADATPFVFTNTGEGRKPLAGVLLTAQRNDSNDDIAVSWTRRTRMLAPALGGGPVPIGEQTEAYEVDVRQGLTVVRTLTLTEPNFTYTEAMQTADGHALGSPVTVDVYQMSDIRGRGHALTGTV